MKNVLYFLGLSLSLVFAVACDKDDDHHDDGEYHVTIEILSPAEGAEATMGEALHVEVKFTREESKTIHNIQVDILDSAQNVVRNLVTEHAHAEGEYEFHSMDFTPTVAGDYTLLVTTTNDNMEEPNTLERSFKVIHDHGSGGDYDVDVEIVKPTADQTVKMNEPLEVEILYTHHDGETIHHVKIEVLDASDDVVETLSQEHVHTDASYTYTSSDYSPAAEGTFRLRAATFNHDMSVEKHAMQTFIVEQ